MFIRILSAVINYRGECKVIVSGGCYLDDTFFAIEDIHGVRAEKHGDEVHIVFDGSKRTMDESIFKMLSAWADQAEKLRNGEISKEQYDHWRYTFPAEDTTQRWAKVPSQELSDMLIAALKEDKE